MQTQVANLYLYEMPKCTIKLYRCLCISGHVSCFNSSAFGSLETERNAYLSAEINCVTMNMSCMVVNLANPIQILLSPMHILVLKRPQKMPHLHCTLCSANQRISRCCSHLYLFALCISCVCIFAYFIYVLCTKHPRAQRHHDPYFRAWSLQSPLKAFVLKPVEATH